MLCLIQQKWPEKDDEYLHGNLFTNLKNEINVDIDKSNIIAAYRVGQRTENKHGKR